MLFLENLKKIVFICFVICGVCLPSICLADEGAAAYKSATDYEIGVGDILRINTWKEPDLSLDAALVRSDGKITFPLIDDIQAQGVSTMKLKAEIEKKLAEYVESPNVTVTLENPVSQKFYILGEVANTGEYPIIKKITVMQAFALSGGFTEWASKNKILLIRRSDGKEETIVIKYNDILKGDFSKDIPLMADDTIIVP